MWEITQGDAQEGEPQEIALLDSLGKLMEMFEDEIESEEDGGVRIPSTADHFGDHSQEPQKQAHRSLWTEHIAKGGTRYWKKDGQWCLVSPRCQLHGGTYGYCSGDNLAVRAQIWKPADAMGGDRGTEKEEGPQQHPTQKASWHTLGPPPKMKVQRSRRGKTYLAPDMNPNEEAADQWQASRQGAGKHRRKVSQWDKKLIADGTPYWWNARTRAQCWSKPRCSLHDNNRMSTLPPCRAPLGYTSSTGS